MDKETITGQDLLQAGWQQGPLVGQALRVAQSALADGADKASILQKLHELNTAPEGYVDDAQYGQLAQSKLEKEALPVPMTLRDELAPLTIWGKELIDHAAIQQIENAAILPVTERVALMPDAHVGYGLPIGGVAALRGAIAPYMVGVDIGCRMHATILDRNPIHLDQDKRGYVGALQKHTYFGRETPRANEQVEHAILDDPRWAQLPRHLTNLRDRARQQLGSSGGGNHFVEWAKVVIKEPNPFGLDAGKYIALVSHSGSRGVGFKIANHYTSVAEQLCATLPQKLRHLAFLDYRMGEAEEYELAMNLAGDFARACHEVIHESIGEALGAEPAATLQNHHNFAWRHDDDGDAPLFIHRKGATPAASGDVGIIPGSMGAPGFFVTGKGLSNDAIMQSPSLNSAAHGSGRRLSRSAAQKKLDREQVNKMLKKLGVTLLGGGLDEAPNAYKDSRKVIAAQTDLVDVWGEFMPAIVRMADDNKKSFRKSRKRRRR